MIVPGMRVHLTALVEAAESACLLAAFNTCTGARGACAAWLLYWWAAVSDMWLAHVAHVTMC